MKFMAKVLLFEQNYHFFSSIREEGASALSGLANCGSMNISPKDPLINRF
jgi:hypothetical protein